MKSTLKTIASICLVTIGLNTTAQVKKQSLAVLNIDAAYKFNGLTPKSMGDLIRREVEKLDTFEVVVLHTLLIVISFSFISYVMTLVR